MVETKKHIKNNPDTQRAYFLRNKRKINESQKRWRALNPDKVRKYRANYEKNHPVQIEEKNFRTKVYFLKKVDLSFDQFKEMLERQDHRCAICGNKEKLKHQSGTARLLCIDHDHKTMKVRGLLCQRCNTAIGFLNDDISLVQKALAYLKQYDNS